MHPLLRIRSTARSILRPRGSSLSAETGDTLIEVLIASVIVVLIAVASLAGFDVANRSSADSKRHTQAEQLAQQDQDRLRALQVPQLLGSLGNQTQTFTLGSSADQTTFTVNSSSRFVSDASGNSSCTTSGTGNADYIKTTSSVTWANMGVRTPVVAEGIITPPAGGSMLVQVTDQASNPLSGVAVVVTGTGSGTTPNSSATTDSNGCAIFGGLVDGAYSLNTTETGYVDPSGNASPTSAQTVVAGATDTATVQMGRATQINASFQTYWIGSPISRPTNQAQWVAANTGLPAPGFRVFGTAGAYTNPVNSPNTIFPFTTPYNAYVGSCSSNDPVANGQSSDPTASVTPGGSPVAVTLTAPTLAIQPYLGSNSASGAMVGYPSPTRAASTVPDHVKVTDNNCGVVRAYTPASSPSTVAPSSATGVLSDAAQPYGNYTVCADYTKRSGTPGNYTYSSVRQTATVANNVTAGTTVPLYFAAPVAGVC